MKLIKIDGNGMFVKDVFVDEYPKITQEVDGEEVQINDPTYISTPCPGGFYWPKWGGSQWVEGLTQEEINAIQTTPTAKTIEERVGTVEVTTDEIVDVLAQIVGVE